MPLSKGQIDAIKATVPVVKEHGNQITKVFYDTLLHDVPDLNNLFNHANQVQGHQSEALANALYAYAANIDNLSALGPAVNKISHKHASLYIQPSQYDIVGTYLLRAMSTVLGAALTPPILDAWSAAYKQLADLMIGVEESMLREAAKCDWTSWRPFVIADKVKEAAEITSFYLKPKDGKPLPKYLPGQYISVQMEVPDLHYLQSRQYSLSGEPRQDYYRISVKKESGVSVGDPSAPAHPGYVSNVLHDDKNVGDVVEVSYPRGDFFLDLERTLDFPIVLISAGVGVTPMVAILETLVARGHEQPIEWVHATRSRRLHAFGEHVRELGKEHGNVRVEVFNKEADDGEEAGYDFKGRMDLGKLDRERDLHVGDARTEYYVCGPEGFMMDVKKTLVGYGVKEEKIKCEIFSTGMGMLDSK